MRIMQAKQIKRSWPPALLDGMRAVCIATLCLSLVTGLLPSAFVYGQTTQPDAPVRGHIDTGDPDAGETDAQDNADSADVQAASAMEASGIREISSCTNGPNDLGGTVWRDYNSDGVQGQYEPGFNQVTVSAYDKDGLVDTTIPDGNGVYNFASIFQGRSGEDAYIRLEFTNFPEWIEASVHGTDSGSTVQFHSAPTCYANVSLQNPADYCENNPQIVTSCYAMGTHDGPNSDADAIVSFPYGATGHDMDDITKLTSWNEIGSVYGAAWNPKTEHIYFSAYYKRYVGFGPNGPDAIYQLNRTGDVVGVIELDTLLSGTDTAGPDTHDLTTIGSNGEVNDEAAFGQVGRTSFGDLELSDDMNTLYVVNLFDKKIYGFSLADGNANNVSLINTPGGSGTDFGWITPNECGSVAQHPFGLAWHEDKLWIGSVCESDGSEGVGNAYVHSLDLNGSTFDLEISIPLDHSREDVFRNGGGLWNPWSSDMEDPIPNINQFGDASYPQPILSDIEFDPADGSMILGVRDRWGDQTGSDINTPFTGVYIEGQLIKLESVEYDSPQAGQSTWYYDVESRTDPSISHVTFGINYTSCANIVDRGTWSGTVQAPTHNSGNGMPETANPDPTTGVTGLKFDQGFDTPEGRGYYFILDNNYAIGKMTVGMKAGTKNPVVSVRGPDTTNCLLTGQQVSSTSQSTTDESLASSGSNTESDSVVSGTSASDSIWGNAGGDILRVCNTESGWQVEGMPSCPTNGENNNSGPGGSQDAEYYNWDFQNLARYTYNDPTTNNFHSEITQGGLVQVANRSTIMSTSMNPFDDYSGGVLRFENAHGRREGVAPPPAQDRTLYSTLGGGYTLFDSGDYNSGPPNIEDTFGKANGLGDLEALCQAAPIEIGNFIWLDADSDGIQDPNELPLINITVSLYDSNGNPVATAVTNNDGAIHFIDETDPRLQSGGIWESAPPTHVGVVSTANGGLVPETDYQIRIPLDQASLAGASPSPTNQTALNDGNDDIRDSDGDPDINPGFVSADVTINAAGNNEHTIDFGFFQFLGSAQGRTWQDLNLDGIQDEGEPGSSGVVVNLLNESGTLVATEITDGDGNYTLNTIPPGNYVVEFDPAPFVAFSPQDQGEDDSIDSDPDTITGQTELFSVSEEAPAVYYDAGVTRQQAINYPPRLPSPGDQVNAIGDDVLIILTAIDSILDVLLFEATELPPGISIDAATGELSGTPTTTGRYDVVITVYDDKGASDTMTFAWTINQTPEPVCDGLEREAEDAQLIGFAKTVLADGASNDQHILVPEQTGNEWNGPDDGYAAHFCFTVETGGIYRIVGNVRGSSNSSDSFYVKVDDGPSDGYLWDVIAATDYITDYVNHRDVADPVEVSLSSGQHDVSVFLREDGTRLDKLALELVSAFPEPEVDPEIGNCGGMEQEAEDGEIYGGFVVRDDAEASGGKYIQVPDSYGNNFSDGPVNDKVEYCFNVPANGTYLISGTIHARNGQNDSFYVTAEATPDEFYLWDTKTSQQWIDDYVNDRSGDDPVLLNLTADQHLITIYLREDGTRLDKLALVEASSVSAAGSQTTKQDTGGGKEVESNIVGTLLVTTTFSSEPILAGLGVSLSNGQGFESASETNHVGKYYIDNVPPGDYTLKVEATGKEEKEPIVEQAISITEPQPKAAPVQTSVEYVPERAIKSIYLPMISE